MSLKSVVSQYGNSLVRCLPTDFIDEAIALMVQNHRNAIAVMEPGNKLVGIFTDHDVIRAVHSSQNSNYDIASQQVQDWMTPEVVTCPMAAKLTESMRIMGKHNIRHLAVKDKGRVVAIVSIRDVLAQIHHDDELEVNVLRDIALASRGIVAA